MGVEKTIGEIRVRTEFNPDKNGTVDLIKQKSAELINLVEGLRKPLPEAVDNGGPVVYEFSDLDRLIEKAQIEIEEAAMWAVKAATA